MAASIARRLVHRLGRCARRPPAGAVCPTRYRAALRPRPPHCHQLVAQLRRGARLQALLLPARQRRSQDLSHRWGLAPHPSPPAPGRWAGHAAGLRHRRLAHQAVRAARRGRWQASQPHSGTGRVPVPLRPRLGLSGPPGPTLALGSDRPADPLALVHPSQGCRLDGGLLRLAVPHQVGAGRRPDRVAGPAVGARSPADLGGDRRGLRQAAVLEADAGCGGDGDQSAALRCRLVVVAAGGRSRPEEGSRPAAEVRQGPDRPGQDAPRRPGAGRPGCSPSTAGWW